MWGFFTFNWFLTPNKREIQEKIGNFSVCWMNVTPLNSNDRPFAWSGDMFKITHARGTSKTKASQGGLVWIALFCSALLWRSHVQLVSKHVWFCNMWEHLFVTCEKIAQRAYLHVYVLLYFMVSSLSSQCILWLTFHVQGAAIIRMLEDVIGKDVFFQGLQHYLQTYKFSNAKTNDLWQCLTEQIQHGQVHLNEQW